MKYIVNNSNDPAYNIALEAYAFKELTDIDEIFKHIYLTMGLGCGIILDGTFYFWSLKSVQGRADKCCKSTHR